MPLGAAIQVLGTALFLWAAALSRRLHRRDGLVGDWYLTVGLVFAAFAQIQTAILPGTYTGLVTGGDLLRLVFDVILLLGIQAQAGALLARLRPANEDLVRLGRPTWSRQRWWSALASRESCTMGWRRTCGWRG